MCQQRGRTQKTVDSAGGIKIQKTVRMLQPLREVFGLLGWVLVAQLRCPDDVGRICSYIQDESK